MTHAVLDGLPELNDSAPPKDAESAVRAIRDKTRGPRSRHKSRGGRSGGHKPTKAELEREVKQLRAERASAADDGAPSMEEQEAALLAASMRGPLSAAILTASRMLARVAKSDLWELQQEEADRLAEVWAPVTAPQLARHADKLPVVMACGVTLEIFMPRVTEQLERQRVAKALTTPTHDYTSAELADDVAAMSREEGAP